MLFASVCNINTPGQRKESLGQTSQSLQFSLSSHNNATLALSLDVAYLRHRQANSCIQELLLGELGFATNDLKVDKKKKYLSLRGHNLQ
jgi:hypothetical protein